MTVLLIGDILEAGATCRSTRPEKAKAALAGGSGTIII
jgi:hypothetical protein